MRLKGWLRAAAPTERVRFMKRCTAIVMACFFSAVLMTACTNPSGGDLLAADTAAIEQAKLAREELRTFYEDNKTLLHDLQTRLSSLYQEFDVFTIAQIDSHIVVRDGSNTPIDILDSQVRRQAELYFDAVGTYNDPVIMVHKMFGIYPAVQFSSSFDVEAYKCIVYSPEYIGGNWDRLEDDWFLFTYYME